MITKDNFWQTDLDNIDKEILGSTIKELIEEKRILKNRDKHLTYKIKPKSDTTKN